MPPEIPPGGRSPSFGGESDNRIRKISLSTAHFSREPADTASDTMNPHSPDMTVPVTAEAFFPPDSLPVPSGQDDASICETEAILIAVAQAVEQRDHHTARHCERLALTSVALGMALHLDR